MKNHGLGTHNDKMWADSLTENTRQFIRPICQIVQLCGIFLKLALITITLSLAITLA